MCIHIHLCALVWDTISCPFIEGVLYLELPCGSTSFRVSYKSQEKELYYGAPAPRLLSLDSYFLTEVEKMERDPVTGRRVKKRIQEYEYEPEMEQAYRYGGMELYHN